jgi:uncharacterized protein (TIGR02266 family)
MSHADPTRERVPSWVHEDGSVVRLRVAKGSALGPEASRVERRRGSRIPVELTVFVHAAAHFFQAETVDVSQGGMFLATDLALPVGTRVVLDFGLPGATEPLELEAVVRWGRTEGDQLKTGAPRGLALAFQRVAPHAAARLEAYCKVREPLYFDLIEG